MVKDSGQTPMMRQYHAVKKDHPQDIVFFRMGDFYEMMFEDAIEASRVLGITLTKRGKGTAAEAPMCGVPFHAAEGYIAKLVKQGYRVAICDQVEDAKEAKGLVRREVVRVVTPGTTLDENVMDGHEFQYLAVILNDQETFACAWIEFSTGRFELSHHVSFSGQQNLVDLLATRNPAELVLPPELQLDFIDPAFLKNRCVTRLEPWHFGADFARQKLLDHFEVLRLDGFGLEDALLIRVAGGALSYLYETQKHKANHIQNLKVLQHSEHLILDAATQRNLELTRTLFEGNRKESFLGQIDMTQTAMGARLLKEWVLAPLMDLTEIRERQTFVSSFVHATIPRSEIRNILKGIPDLDRQLGKLAMRAINPRELLGLGNALEPLPDLVRYIAEVVPDQYGLTESDLTAIWQIRTQIEQWIEPETPVHTRNGGVIQSGNHAELDELRLLRRDSRSTLAQLERDERERTGIPKLKVQYNKVFGYYIEISKSYVDKAPDHYIRKQTLVNCERYITEELKVYEEKILGAETRILELENECYENLITQLMAQLEPLRRWSHCLALVDVHCALAELAVVRHYCRPDVNDGPEIVIQEGRHPVIEALSDERFIANDTYLNNELDRMIIITGPNMGGKSTYLRQVALICLMAQMGSWVPATKAEIGVVDRIFTRVGASDHLAKGQSTFMVEMTETAHILNHASARSLIILDEIGRGTSTFDGLSIAWATAEYILDTAQIGAKTLFATHYHEMTELEKLQPGVRNFQITVREWNNRIVFLRRIERGAADQSYGIHVAQLAGLPKALVGRAREILKNLEKNELDTTGQPKLARGGKPSEPEQQLSLFGPEPSEIEEELRHTNLDDLSPKKALELLYRWKDLL
ncbi:MAG: DNA mismatch repair protein MutS [Acidobacteria bacterium]|nr:DNA mismatch repair protein MutS [Acidobacteriota bacterium]MCB9398451.1 DNA mismatch repair protein MutS [Acidobacteriota bacterium]